MKISAVTMIQGRDGNVVVSGARYPAYRQPEEILSVCVAEVSGGRTLRGSILGIGDGPLPFGH